MAFEIHLYPRAVRPTTAEERAVDTLRTKLEQYSRHVREVRVRFDDVIRPSGRIDRSCRVEVTLVKTFDAPRLSIEGRAPNAQDAVALAADGIEGAVRREVEEAERRRRRSRKGKRAQGAAARVMARAPAEELEGEPPPTEYDLLELLAEQGHHATPRSVKTANPRRGRHIHKTQRQARATAAQELSATRPSRKSTRRSANRSKRDSNLQRRTSRAVRSPEERSRRGAPAARA